MASLEGYGSSRVFALVIGRSAPNRALGVPFSVGCCRGLMEGAHRQQRDAEVADPIEDAVQLRLVDDRAGQAGSAVVEANQGEVAERGGPVIVEVTGDPDLVHRGVGRRRAGPAGAGWVGDGSGHVGAPAGALWVVSM